MEGKSEMALEVPVSQGITARTIVSSRLSTRVLFAGPEDGEPVFFVHGNVSSATFWEDTMLDLPPAYRGIAADNRGYGGADPEMKIDATRGLRDLSDDLAALMDTLAVKQAHVVGHSLGGSVLWQFMIDHTDRILSVTLVSPGSPYGFGGTKGADGQLCFPDAAGSGAGITSPEFVQQIIDQNTSGDSPSAPRTIMNSFYWKPPFRPKREEALLLSMLSIHTGPQDWPGDAVPSSNWPMVSPGVFGPNNAISPLYQPPVDSLLAINPKPSVLWVRGAEDQIVSDSSLFDIGTLGQMGAVPGWPGSEVFPPQPMLSQTRAVLDDYARLGGHYSEVTIEDAGHSAYIEKPEAFNKYFHRHIEVN
jgi:pimeloyl-ACP methyl ester carboxylesterase